MRDSDDATVFRVTGATSFLWKYMDDAYIVYDSRSGHSQALNDFAYEIFDIIKDKPCNLSDIQTEVQKILEYSLPDDVMQQVSMVVGAFDKMGLIEPMRPDINGKSP